MKCMLDSDLNQCPYYVRDRQSCSREKEAGTCTFQEPDEPSKPVYERKERWYEKYYR